jgi:hypothetical protein
MGRNAIDRANSGTGIFRVTHLSSSVVQLGKPEERRGHFEVIIVGSAWSNADHHHGVPAVSSNHRSEVLRCGVRLKLKFLGLFMKF